MTTAGDTQVATLPTDNDLAKELSHAGELTPISIAEARRVMGVDGANLSDDEVQSMILNFTAIARAHIGSVLKY